MGFLKRRLLGRFGPVARLFDMAMVAGVGIRLAARKGWVSESTMRSLGMGSMAADAAGPRRGQAGGSAGAGDLALLAGALWRLFRGRRRQR